MKTLFAGAVIALSLWLLMYLNELSSVPTTKARLILYPVCLLYPSIGFWVLLWVQERWVMHDVHAELISKVSLAIAAALLMIGVLPAMLRQVPRPEGPPGLVSLFLASYCFAIILALAALLRLHITREYILHNRFLGKLALGLAVALWIFDLVQRGGLSHALETRGATVTLPSIVFIVLFLAGLLLAFASLLNMNAAQNLMGLAVLASLSAFVVLSRPYLFVAIWLGGPTFWLLILFSSLISELLLWRAAKYLANAAMLAVSRSLKR